jgi:regulator of protease activity HflC (stomatin/prohibitin superfamily)
MQKSDIGGLLVAASIVIVAVSIWLGRKAAKVKSTTIYEWQRGLLYRHGRFEREVSAGRYRLAFGRWIAAINVNPVVLVVGPQEVLTADRFLVKLTARVTLRVIEPRKAYENNGAGDTPAVRGLVQIAIRDLVVGRPLDVLIDARAQLDLELKNALAGPMSACGCQVEAAEARDLILAAEVRRMYTDIERARREGQAALERARAEQAALRALANAARMLKGNPELMNLRILQALQPSGRAQPTLVLGGATGLVPIGPRSEAGGDEAPELET